MIDHQCVGICNEELSVATRNSNAKLDLGKFAKLTELEVLKLRGFVGLVQPAFSFTGGLTELSNLTKLHTLVSPVS